MYRSCTAARLVCGSRRFGAVPGHSWHTSAHSEHLDLARFVPAALVVDTMAWARNAPNCVPVVGQASTVPRHSPSASG
jgi:hypothetical protein